MTTSLTQTDLSTQSVSMISFHIEGLADLPAPSTRVKSDMRSNEDRPSTPKQSELVPSLLAISKTMRALRGIKLASLGFNNGQDELLMSIPANGLSVNELANLLMIRPSTVSKMTDRLIEKGLMERGADLRDKRRRS